VEAWKHLVVVVVAAAAALVVVVAVAVVAAVPAIVSREMRTEQIRMADVYALTSECEAA
jgi:hypothetical protein